MPPVPFGLLPKSPCNAYAAIALTGPGLDVWADTRYAKAPVLYFRIANGYHLQHAK
jgi:hypothetical protein